MSPRGSRAATGGGSYLGNVRQLALDGAGAAATQELLALAGERSPQSPGRSGMGIVGGSSLQSLDRPTLRYQRYHGRETDGESSSRRPVVMVKDVVAE